MQATEAPAELFPDGIAPRPLRGQKDERGVVRRVGWVGRFPAAARAVIGRNLLLLPDVRF